MKLWTRNFSLITIATTLGSIGAIAGSFALSFLVFDETGSTLAASLIVAIQLIPFFVIPLFAAPIMDRLPRKPFVVFGDVVNGILFLIFGMYLRTYEFSYGGYILFSLALSAMTSFDELAYNSLYPKLIPQGMEQKGFAVSSMLYPVLKMLMMPISAVLFESIGVANLLLIQGFLSIAAAITESFVKIEERRRLEGKLFSVKQWWGDIKEAASYIKGQRGLRSIYSYMAIANGLLEGYNPLMVAFFRTMPGLTVTMYSFFSVVLFAGRLLGGFTRYLTNIKPKKRFACTFIIYQLYELTDVTLLWLPYPLMLVNRFLYGFLGINSKTLRQTAVQMYLPDTLRTRVNAFESMLLTAVASVLSLAVGALGEVLDYRLCMTIFAAFTMLCCWLIMWRNRKHVSAVYEYEKI